MARWAPDAAVRLERAALELFAEQGYDATTVPQITERAGLTARTFFRHYADKREVLFLREREFPAVVASVLAAAPPSLSPMELVMHGLQTVAERDLVRWRRELAVRRDVLRADERLRERELLKSAGLAAAMGTPWSTTASNRPRRRWRPASPRCFSTSRSTTGSTGTRRCPTSCAPPASGWRRSCADARSPS
jgi:AcrR family transcriptional regulator